MPIVPPGHKVLVVKPQPEPGFSRMPSGPWILNFGEPRFLESGLRTLNEFLARNTERTSVIWLMVADIVAQLASSEALTSRSLECGSASTTVTHLAVFPDDTPERPSLMAAFKTHGFGVHYGGPDRECYVEVHKPDRSIVVGMPGPAFELAGSA
jgi:hypothetical protein